MPGPIKGLQSSLLKLDQQLQRTLNGGSESAICLGTSAHFVYLIQVALQRLGYGRFLKRGVNSHFDDPMRQAVEQFQQDRNLSVHGIVDGQTLEAIDSALSGLEQDAYRQSVGASVQSTDNDDKDYSFRPFVQGVLKLNSSSTVAAGQAKVSPKVALSILDNMAGSSGKISFLPEEGRVGECSWFTIEGSPYVGRLNGKTVETSVEVKIPKNALVFKEVDLSERVRAKAQSLDAEASYRDFNKIPKERPLNRSQKEGVERLARGKAEVIVWNEVGESVRNHPSKVGIVEYDGVDRGKWSLSEGSPGKTIAVANSELITIRDGGVHIVDGLEELGHAVESDIRRASEEIIRRFNTAAKVRAVFKYGGRVLVVVGVGLDLYKIYRAKSRLREVVSVAGGWGGATAAATLFAELWTPADAAGPVAWAVHGVGTLVAGGIGYYLGSETTSYVYELVLEAW